MKDKPWLHNEDDMIRSLLADEAKAAAILSDMDNTLKQLRAKSSFRLALLNTICERRGIPKPRNDK